MNFRIIDLKLKHFLKTTPGRIRRSSRLQCLIFWGKKQKHVKTSRFFVSTRNNNRTPFLQGRFGEVYAAVERASRDAWKVFSIPTVVENISWAYLCPRTVKQSGLPGNSLWPFWRVIWDPLKGWWDLQVGDEKVTAWITWFLGLGILEVVVSQNYFDTFYSFEQFGVFFSNLPSACFLIVGGERTTN